MIFCDSGHLHNEHKARGVTKTYDHWQGPMNWARATLISEMGGGKMYKVSKLTF